jgi:UDP-glucose 6-dehydrogenase
MGVCVIGKGYVGLVTGACLGDIGHHVWGKSLGRRYNLANQLNFLLK